MPVSLMHVEGDDQRLFLLHLPRNRGSIGSIFSELFPVDGGRPRALVRHITILVVAEVQPLPPHAHLEALLGLFLMKLWYERGRRNSIDPGLAPGQKRA